MTDDERDTPTEPSDPNPEMDEAAPTPRVSTPEPPPVTKPTPEALRGSRREPTWTSELDAHGPTKFSPPPLMPREIGSPYRDPPSSPHVLIVDDDADIRAGLRELLEDEGYVVVEASNGLEGLKQLFRSSTPWPSADLIMLDLMMPKLNGLEFLEVVQPSPAGDIPIIVISGNPRSDYADLDDTFVFLRKGDFGNVEALLRTIRRHIEEGRDRRALLRRT